MVDLPPSPVRRPRTAAELAASSAEMERITAETVERMDRQHRHEGSRKTTQTPQAKARHAAQARAGKVRGLVIDLDYAQRHADLLRMLEAPLPTIDAAQHTADKLQARLADQLEKVRESAVAGCEVSKALLLELTG